MDSPQPSTSGDLSHSPILQDPPKTYGVAPLLLPDDGSPESKRLNALYCVLSKDLMNTVNLKLPTAAMQLRIDPNEGKTVMIMVLTEFLTAMVGSLKDLSLERQTNLSNQIGRTIRRFTRSKLLLTGADIDPSL